MDAPCSGLPDQHKLLTRRGVRQVDQAAFDLPEVVVNVGVSAAWIYVLSKDYVLSKGLDLPGAQAPAMVRPLSV